MTSSSFAAVNLLLAMENSLIRKGLRDAFRASGFKSIAEAGTQTALQQSLGESAFDLVIMTPEFGGVFVAPLVSEIRNGRFGVHRFPIIVILVPNPDGELVRKIIDCGPDDMLLMPVAPGQILSRIEVFAKQRKPFVVTQDYTGPDRRKQNRPGTEQIPLLEVPNPLKVKGDTKSRDDFLKETAKATMKLETLKIERYAVQIRWLDRTVRKIAGDETEDVKALYPLCVRMKAIVQDLPSRLGDEMSDAIKERANRLEQIARALQAGKSMPNAEQLDLLSAASEALAGVLLDHVAQKMGKAA